MIHHIQVLDSTGSKRKELEDARKIVTDMTPTEHVCVAYEDELYCFTTIGDTNENTIYSNLTGQFPVRSYDGIVPSFVLMFINVTLFSSAR